MFACCTPCSRGLLLVALMMGRLSLRAEDPQTPMSMLIAVQASTGLYAEGLKPWYSKMEVQLYDPAGKPTETGTIEEWWSGPGLDKTVYSTPSHASTSLTEAGKHYRSGDSSYVGYFLQKLQNMLVRPIPGAAELAERSAELHKGFLHNVPIDCITLKDNKSMPGDGFCVSPDGKSLRAVVGQDTITVLLNNVGTFQLRQVAVDLLIQAGDVTRATGHLAALTTRPMPDGVYATDGLIEDTITAHETKCVALGGTPQVVQPKLLSSRKPNYPLNARAQRRTGAVVIFGIIGLNGHIHSLEVLSTPDSDMAASALGAIREWRYEPYMLNGIPVEMETLIHVNFIL